MTSPAWKRELLAQRGVYPDAGGDPRRVLDKDQGLKFPRTARKRKPRVKVTAPEATTQDLVEQYLRWNHLPYLHIPEFLLANAFGWRPMSGAEKGAASEAAEEVRGFPDLAIFYRGRVLAIELKTEAGKMTTAQRDWQQRLGTLCLRSFDEARAAIDEWKAKIEAESKR